MILREAFSFGARNQDDSRTMAHGPYETQYSTNNRVQKTT
jgi:hypothetical protein